MGLIDSEGIKPFILLIQCILIIMISIIDKNNNNVYNSKRKRYEYEKSSL